MYPGSFSSLDEVNFTNFRLPVFEQGNTPNQWIQLRRGEYEKRKQAGAEWASLRRVDFFETYAVVQFSWTVAGGSSTSLGVLQLWQLESHRLYVRQQIISVHPTESRFDPDAKRLTIKATHYARTDPHCCPSKQDIITLRWTGSEFAVADVKTVAKPEPR